MRKAVRLFSGHSSAPPRWAATRGLRLRGTARPHRDERHTDGPAELRTARRSPRRALTGRALLIVPRRASAGTSHFSVSTRPRTNHRCMTITTATGGSNARWCRHDEIPVGLGVAGPDHLGDADDDGLHAAAGRDQERPQVLVPAIEEEDDEEGGHVGPGERQQDVAKEAQGTGPIDLGRLDQLGGDGQEELPEQEGRGGGRDQGHRQTPRRYRSCAGRTRP